MSRADMPARVYLGRGDGRNFKIGISCNPDYRLRTVGAVVVAAGAELPRRDAWRIEQALHRECADLRISGEWYSLTQHDEDSVVAAIYGLRPVETNARRATPRGPNRRPMGGQRARRIASLEARRARLRNEIKGIEREIRLNRRVAAGART